LNTAKRINKLLDKEDWKGARRLVRGLRRADPDDHWLMTKMAQAYCGERKYAEALRWSRRALALAPKCPIARWDYAGINWESRRKAAAFRVWEKFINGGARACMRGPCGRSRAWARSLITDCHLMEGWYFEHRGNLAGAIRKLRLYVRRRESGSGSSYSLGEQREELRRLEAWVSWYAEHPETKPRPGQWRGELV
jgi:tetratricopeptide (TPR) repeat protein